jgi:flavodoxin
VRALIVYESMFGNTEQIARAIAVGLGSPSISASLM